MPDIREILYPIYPIKVGNPKQYLVYNRDERDRFAAINSGQNDEDYASTCAYDDEGNPIFLDLFLENDEIDPVPVRKVVLWYEARKIPWVVLLSGRAGFHCHGLFEPDIVKQRTVKNLAKLIIKDTETEDKFDPHVTGDFKRLCRIPNTQRVGNGWCVPITREELFTLNTPDEFKRLCIAPRFLNFTEVRRPSIFDFIKEDETEDKPVQIHIAPPKEIFFIKHMLRPCVYKALTTPNPRHVFRLTAVVELMNHGLTVLQIFRVFERLQWIDFCHEKTKYQLDKIEEKRRNGELMVPFGKIKLGCKKLTPCINCILNGDNN